MRRFHVGALEVEAVPAEHDGGRGPFGASGAAVGYVVTGSSTVYFAGDTDLFEGMGALGRHRRRADPDLGVGADSRAWRASRPGACCRGGQARRSARRGPDPLGDVLPDSPRPARRSPVPRAAARRVRGRRPRACARGRGACLAAGGELRLRGRRKRPLGSGEQLGLAERGDRVLADLARDLRDVRARWGVRDHVQPCRRLADDADLHVERQVVGELQPGRPLRRSACVLRRERRRGVPGAAPSPTAVDRSPSCSRASSTPSTGWARTRVGPRRSRARCSSG